MLCYILIVSVTVLPRCLGLFGFGRLQSVATLGDLQCNGYPATNVKVKLYDKGILFDTKLAEGRTDPDGRFYLTGWKREFSNIDPKLSIYHKCNHTGACYRKFSIPIPSSYITEGKTAKKIFHPRKIELAVMNIKESIDCFN